MTLELLHAADAEVRQRRAAGALLARGCREGDRVAFALGSSADLICAVLGAARVGLIPVLLNATLTPAERDHLAEDAQPTLRIFSAADLAGLADGAGPPAGLAPYPLTRPMHYTSGTTGRPKGVTTGIWDEATARAVFEDEAAVWHFDRRDLHAALGRLARRLAPLRRRDGPRHPAPTPPDHGLLGPDPPAADPPVPRLRRRRDLRLAPAPGPRRRALPGVAEAVRHGARAPRRAVGVLRLDGGPVHGLLARGVARAARHRGTGEGRPPALRRPVRHHLVRHARLRPLQLLAGPRRHTPGLARRGLHRRRPGPARSGRLPLPDGPAPRPHHQRWGERLSGRGRERARRGRRGARGRRVRPARRAMGTAGLRRLRGGRQPGGRGGPAGCRLGPYKRPKTYVAATDLPHTATGKLMRRAVPGHLGLDTTGRTG